MTDLQDGHAETQEPQTMSEAKRALLERYMQGRAPKPAQSAVPARNAAGSPVPLSLGQQQLWLVAQLTPDAPVYNECITIGINGPLQAPALEFAFNEVLRRHESWRTTFGLDNGEPVQIVHPPEHMSLPIADLRDLPPSEREAEASRLATARAVEPMDLLTGPLLRPLLVHLDDNTHHLYLAMHHIIFDGYTIHSILLPELYAIYRSTIAGETASLPQPPIQYTDFALWQREGGDSESVHRQLAHWKEALAGVPDLLDLPTDRPRPAVQTYRGSMEWVRIPPALVNRLKRLSRQENVTLFMTMVAGFTTLLYRYSGQDDIVVGTSTAGRKRSEFERVSGYFLNVVPLRADLGGNPTFRDLLSRVREMTLQAYSNDEVPFEQLIREIQPRRDPSYNPLFQVMMSIEPPLTGVDPGWTLSQVDVDTGTAKFDLSLELDDRPDGIIGRLQYSTELFDAATIKRLLGHFQRLLEAIVDNPEFDIDSLRMITEGERHQLVVEWNRTGVPIDADRVLHALVEDQVSRVPDATAVTDGAGSLTYAELDQRARSLAHRLHAAGVRQGDIVGVYLDRSVELIVAILATLKVGAAYLPLDPAYPRDRIAFMVDDAGARTLVTRETLASDLSAYGSVLCVDAPVPEQAESIPDVPAVAVGPHDPAYVIYTSGSTGQPKGVVVEHRQAVHSTLARRDVYREPVQSYLLLQSPSFDSSVAGIFWTLTQGGNLILPDAGVRTDPAGLAALAGKHHVSHLLAVPSLYHVLLDALTLQKTDALRVVVVAGESCPGELVQRHRALLPDVQLFNEYGPTEATVWSTVYSCEQYPGKGPVSIGRPIPDARVYILDRGGAPTPIGVPGELFIGGPGVARGYLQRPELTEERFVPDPFGDAAERLYRTGDRARYRDNGDIEFQGRLDQQLKVRGYRIEPAEIESVLNDQPDIDESMVVAHDDASGDTQLAAYVILASEPHPSLDTIRRRLRNRLPEYMIPTWIVPIDRWPLNPNGKIDRSALPSPALDRRPSDDTFVGPETFLQGQIVGIWEELLGLDRISIRDNFFDLGGHSLLAVRMMSRLEDVCGKRLPVTTLIENATVEQLARVVQTETERDPLQPIIQVRAGRESPPLVWLHGDLRSGGVYCVYLARQLGGDRPFLAVEPHGAGARPIPDTIEAMAADYIDALAAVQPRGPYLLGGYCNGGLVAYEMACRLRARGETVDLVIMVDAVADSYLPHIVQRVVAGLGKLARLEEARQKHIFARLRTMVYFLELSAPGKLDFVEYIARERLPWVSGLIRRRQGTKGPVPGDAAPPLAARREDLDGYIWAVAQWVPDHYRGALALIWSKGDVTGGTGDPTMGWVRSAPDVSVHLAPGTHWSIISTHAEALAAAMRSSLDEVYGGVESPGRQAETLS